MIGSKNYSESYTYNSSDGSLATMEAANGTKLYYTYDGLKRLQRVTTKSAAGTSLFYSQTEYKAGAETRQTTNQVSGYGYYNADDSIRYKNTYTYDNLGNIAQIKEVLPSGSTRVLAKYTYDNENQLTQEVRYSYTGNSLSGTQTTVTYTYDTAGNLLQSSDGTTAGTVSYTYGNSKWADLLTGIQIGNTTKTITYDGDSGNPTYWYNGTADYYDLTWEQGRRLTYLEAWDANSQNRISYSYDMSGIRTSKVIESERHDYVTQNSKVVRELVTNANTGAFQYCLDFFYDAAGRPYAMRKYEDEALTTYGTYHYLLNAQGDVMGLFHQSGTVKATYTYDAWGRVLTATGDLADVNPLRYRGYYFDQETGWYYLQSRYYDPIVKRFLNADVLYSTGQGILGYNMFAYCKNSPECRIDEQGRASREAIISVPVAVYEGSFCVLGFEIIFKISVDEYAKLAGSSLCVNSEVGADYTMIYSDYLHIQISTASIIYGGTITVENTTLQLSYSWLDNSFTTTYRMDNGNEFLTVSITIKGNDDFMSRDLCASQVFKRGVSSVLTASAGAALGYAVCCYGGTGILKEAK